MKKYILVISCIIISIFLLYFLLLKTYYFISAPKEDLIGVQDDEVYFKMSPRQLIKIKGKPYKKSDDLKESLSMFYYFEENIYGNKCNSVYRFYKNLQLCNLYAVIPVANETEGKELFYKINTHMTDVYSKKKLNYAADYFNDGIVDKLETGGSLYTKFGRKTGPGGQRVEIELKDNSLRIDVYLIE